MSLSMVKWIYSWELKLHKTKMDPETNQKIQEIQIIEQSLQNLMMQKQAFQMELTETQNALKELKDTGDEVYKVIGQLMLKTDKSKMDEELKNKEKIIELRLKTMDQQEKTATEKANVLREEIMKKVNKSK